MQVNQLDHLLPLIIVVQGLIDLQVAIKYKNTFIYLYTNLIFKHLFLPLALEDLL